MVIGDEQPTNKPKFAKRWKDVRTEMVEGVRAYAEEVRSRTFPAPEHTYSIPPEELERLQEMSARRDAPSGAFDW